MWPPVSPILRSTSGGASASRCSTRAAEARGEALDRGLDAVGDLVARGQSHVELVGHVLAERAHHVAALGRDARVGDGLEVQLAPQLVGDVAGLGEAAGAVHGVGAAGDVDRAARGVRGGGELGQAGEREVDLQHRALHRHRLDLLAERGGRAAVEHRQRAPRVGVADHRAGRDLGAVLELDALARAGSRPPARRSAPPRRPRGRRRSSANDTLPIPPRT